MIERPKGRGLAAMTTVAFLAAVGCEDPVEHADVEETVTYRGSPVVWGTVSVAALDGRTYYGTIGPDGRYSIPDVPVGPAKVGIYSPDPYYQPPISAEAKAEMAQREREAGYVPHPKPPKGRWKPIPGKYANPYRSGMTVEVNTPVTVHDCRLN